jgi:hypothetical protein
MNNAIAQSILFVMVFFACGCESPSDPGDTGGDGGEYVVTTDMGGFFSGSYFGVKKQGWETDIGDNVTVFMWRDYDLGLRMDVQLPIGSQNVPTLPKTWNVIQGGDIDHGDHYGITVRAYRNSPPGYDAFLGVSGQLTLTKFDPAALGFRGSFEFVIGAFYYEGSYYYGQDHYYDTNFNDGSFDYQFYPPAIQSIPSIRIDRPSLSPRK